MSTLLGGYNLCVITTPNFSFANFETRNQAYGGESKWKATSAKSASYAHSVTKAKTLNTPPSKSDIGFIAGIVTRKGIVASASKVVCLDDRFNLIAEMQTGDDGSYRFDGLRRDILYTVIAQDSWIFQYAPVGADRRTPEAYP